MRNYKDVEIQWLRPRGEESNCEVWYKIWLESRQAILSNSDGSKLNLSSHQSMPNEFKVGEELVNNSVYKDRVMNMGLQYMNFPTFIFKIQGSCLFRDLLFNLNKLGMWAESNRFLFSILDENAVYDDSNYPISSEYKDIPEWEEQFDKYMEAIRSDKVVDHNRVEMPYSISSKFWICINAKTLIDLLGFLKYEAPFFYEVYGLKLEEYLREAIGEVNIPKKLSASILQYIQKHPESWKEGSTKVDDTYIVNSKMGLILYSQFIRQSDTCISGLFNELMHEDKDKFIHRVFKGGTLLNVHYVAHEDKVLSTVSTRLCAFAMSSGSDPCSWNYFLNNFLPEDITNTDLMNLLPCTFKYNKMVKCKFHDDIKFRNEGKELSNCPCPLVSLNMKDAEAKKARDCNKIGDAFYNLTSYLKYNGLDSEYKANYWTSELIIRTKSPLSKSLIDGIDELLNYIDNNVSTKFGSEYDYDYKNILDEKYSKYSINGDNTCMLKGLAIDEIIEMLMSTGYTKYMISFGGDICSNVPGTYRIDGTNFIVDASVGSGQYSIFTSGNTSKRGNHIVGGKSGDTCTVVRYSKGTSNISNTEVDIIATKMVAGEYVEFLNDDRYRTNVFKFSNGKMTNEVYCASPFFDDSQIEVRDKMISNFTNIFRPDLTDSSKRFDDGDNDAVNEVVDDNINGIKSSEYLAFPLRTNDIGTLFEVGRAISEGKVIITYNENTGLYSIKVGKVKVECLVNKKGDSVLFDCSKKSSVISLGHLSGLNEENNDIYYTLKGNPDNIMLSSKYTHVELNKNGNYEIVRRDPNDRDRSI